MVVHDKVTIGLYTNSNPNETLEKKGMHTTLLQGGAGG